MLRRWDPTPLLAVLVAFAFTGAWGEEAASTAAPPVAVWEIPSVDLLPDDEQGRLARYGRSLVMATYAHIGPDVADAAKRYAGNNLACRNCHLDGGLKKFALLLVGASADYPAYSWRRAQETTIEDRINSCMTRSMNGRPLPVNSREMAALVAYLNVLSTGIPKGAPVTGQGAGKMALLSRPADPVRGRAVYDRSCVACHGPDGLGVRHGKPAEALGYVTPPLWGPDSFNDGAGMNRLMTIANFVHSNMPNGTDWTAPSLPVEDAWDVAAYIVSQPRPHKDDLGADFPDLRSKPVDTPYGPYADGFSQEQHKYGPFGPMLEASRAPGQEAPSQRSP